MGNLSKTVFAYHTTSNVCARTLFVVLLFIFMAGVVFPDSAHARGHTTDPAKTDTEVSLLDPLGWFADKTAGNLFEWLMIGFEKMGGLAASGGGWLLDLSIKYSIETQNLRLPGVELAWETIRDVANMVFIFIFLYIGIATILQISGFNTKRVLAVLIVVALLINFSFFLTGAVIDAGNILALTLYNNLADVNGNGTLNEKGESISEQLANALDLANIFDGSALRTIGNFQKGFAHLFGGILLLLAGFVFLMGAIMFVFRTIALVFVLILSPIAFAAAILPATKSKFNEWLHTLTHQSFVAPIFLLLVGVVLQVVSAGNLVTGNPIQAQVAQTGGTGPLGSYQNSFAPGDPSAFSILLVYAIVLGLMAGAIILARQFAGKVGSLSVNYAGKATGLLAGGLALGLRRTAGPTGAWIREKTKDKSGRTAGAGRAIGGWMSRQSYDLRGTGVARSAGSFIGTDFGRGGGKGGYESDQKEKLKRKTARAQDMEYVSGLDKAEEQRARLKRRHDELQGMEPRSEKEREQIEKHSANIASKLASIDARMDTLKDKGMQRQKARRDEFLARQSLSNAAKIRSKLKTDKESKALRQAVRDVIDEEKPPSPPPSDDNK